MRFSIVLLTALALLAPQAANAATKKHHHHHHHHQAADKTQGGGYYGDKYHMHGKGEAKGVRTSKVQNPFKGMKEGLDKPPATTPSQSPPAGK